MQGSHQFISDHSAHHYIQIALINSILFSFPMVIITPSLSLSWSHKAFFLSHIASINSSLLHDAYQFISFTFSSLQTLNKLLFIQNHIQQWHLKFNFLIILSLQLMPRQLHLTSLSINPHWCSTKTPKISKFQSLSPSEIVSDNGTLSPLRFQTCTLHLIRNSTSLHLNNKIHPTISSHLLTSDSHIKFSFSHIKSIDHNSDSDRISNS